MSKEIENEERLMLTEEQYSLLIKELYNPSISTYIEQTNYYFDDEDFSLKNTHKVLRVRLINNSKYELTLKIKGNDNEGDIEYNTYINSLDDVSFKKCEDETLNAIIDIINSTTKKEIHLITSLTTLRLEIKYDTHLAVIDKNSYSNIIDYDLEVEAPSKEAATKYILEYASKYSLTYKKGYISKSRRAFDAINKN